MNKLKNEIWHNEKEEKGIENEMKKEKEEKEKRR